MQSTLNRLARTAARRPARAQDPAHSDLSFFHEASADELQGLASIAGSSSRDSLGNSSREELATAPPTPAEALRPLSSSDAESSPAATCGAVGSASAGQGSTAALQADAVVHVLFPLLGPRFHAAVQPVTSFSLGKTPSQSARRENARRRRWLSERKWTTHAARRLLP